MKIRKLPVIINVMITISISIGCAYIYYYKIIFNASFIILLETLDRVIAARRVRLSSDNYRSECSLRSFSSFRINGDVLFHHVSANCACNQRDSLPAAIFAVRRNERRG